MEGLPSESNTVIFAAEIGTSEANNAVKTSVRLTKLKKIYHMKGWKCNREQISKEQMGHLSLVKLRVFIHFNHQFSAILSCVRKNTPTIEDISNFLQKP